ncbi:MAG: GntR family transcriptional regulator [Pirellulaceae bacterium]
MKIDPGSHVPIFRQIAQGMGQAIAAGVYRPGEPLPSQRALAVAIQVNPNTVQRAYDELLRQGVAYVQRGKGLFVAERAAASAQDQAQQTVSQAFDAAIHAALAAGMNTKTIRSLFSAALDRAHAEGSPAS